MRISRINKFIITGVITIISIANFSSAANILNLGDFLTVYFEGSSAEISKNWQNIDVKYKNINKDSPLYKSLQKGIYMRLFPNLKVELPIEQYVTQDKAIKLLNISKKTNFEYNKGKKINTIWVKGLIQENLKHLILSKNILEDIKNKLHDNYIYPDKIDEQSLKKDDISKSIENINDDYTVYFPKNDAKDFNDTINGSFEGIGAYIDMIELGKIIIKAPLKNSPAEKHGLKAGDIIVEVDEHKINIVTSTDQLINWVKGPSGTYVKLKIKRGNKEQIIKVKRGKVVLPNVEYEILEGDNCYTSISQFNSQSKTEFQEAMDYFNNKSCEKYIFDVRNNPGGILEDVGYMLNYFVPKNEVAAIIKYKNDRIRMVANDKTKKITDKNVIVLVNGGSASASEIFAGVIRDYVANSILLGTQTFGKGSVQNLINYKDGSMLKYTVAKWYTGKSEKNIDGVGFSPDLKLEDDLNTEMDEVLEVAKIYKFK